MPIPVRSMNQCKSCGIPTELVDPVKLYFFCSDECNMKDDDTQPKGIHEIIQKTGGYPVHCAHRGGGFDFAPENTIYAFKKSVDAGARLLELDLRLTKDNHLVLMHWSTIDETTNGSGHVHEHTLDELIHLDLGYHHGKFRGQGIGIATFKEFLEIFVPIKNLLFCLDFKDIKTCQEAMSTIEPYNIHHRLILGAVFNKPNKFLAQKYPHIPLMSTIMESTRILVYHLFNILHLYHFKHRIFGFVLCPYTIGFWTKNLVDDLHRHNIFVAVSGFGPILTKRKRLQQCIDFGVDFIMTDRPDILNDLMHRNI